MRDHLRCAILATDVMIPPLLNIVADYAHTGMWFTVSINSRRSIRTHVATTNSPNVVEYQTGQNKSDPSDWIRRLDLLAQKLSCSEAVLIPPYIPGAHTTSESVPQEFDNVVFHKAQEWATRCVVREPVTIECARYMVGASVLDPYEWHTSCIWRAEIIAFQCAMSYTMAPRFEMNIGPYHQRNWRSRIFLVNLPKVAYKKRTKRKRNDD